MTDKRIAFEIGVLFQRVYDWKNGIRGISVADARKIKDRTSLELEFILYEKPQVVLKRIVQILEREKEGRKKKRVIK